MDFFREISEKNLKLLENFVFDVYITFVQKIFVLSEFLRGFV
jgi:hypothetical protein